MLPVAMKFGNCLSCAWRIGIPSHYVHTVPVSPVARLKFVASLHPSVVHIEVLLLAQGRRDMRIHQTVLQRYWPQGVDSKVRINSTEQQAASMT